MSEPIAASAKWDVWLSGRTGSSALDTMEALLEGLPVSLERVHELAAVLNLAVAMTQARDVVSRYTLRRMRFCMLDGTDVLAVRCTVPTNPAEAVNDSLRLRG